MADLKFKEHRALILWSKKKKTNTENIYHQKNLNFKSTITLNLLSV